MNGVFVVVIEIHPTTTLVAMVTNIGIISVRYSKRIGHWTDTVFDRT